jgi:sulfur relay (sulfurtransferase) DsrF/TusC family protein
MSEKNLLVIIKSPPYTNLNSYEAMRVAIGLWDHKVTIIWTGEGSYSVLREADHTLTSKFLEDLPDLEIDAYVDEESLKVRGLNSEDILNGIKSAKPEKMGELILDAEASLVF